MQAEMRLGPLGIALGLLFCLQTARAEEPGLRVHGAWVRAAPPGAPLAGYMVVENPTARPRRLVGASSPEFGRVMLHRTVMADGVAEMVHQQSVAIPASGRLALEPGGLHLMLGKPRGLLKAGDEVEIRLELEDGEVLRVTAPVRRPHRARIERIRDV